MSITPPTREIPWADTAAAGHVVEPPDADKGKGWTGTPAPPFQWFNWLLRQAARWIKYLRTRGIPDYDAGETYSPGDRVQFSDAGPPYLTFVCIQANSPPTSKSPYDHEYWEIWGHAQGQLEETVRLNMVETALQVDGILIDNGTISNSLQIVHKSAIGAHIGELCFQWQVTTDATGFAGTEVHLTGASAFSSAIRNATAGVDSTVDCYAPPTIGIVRVEIMSLNRIRLALRNFFNGTTYCVSVRLMGT
jgi:hypothetical protein